MDKVILGDNQFLGVNHRSLSKAVDESERFVEDKAIYTTLLDANDVGVKTFMFTTHNRFETVFEYVRKDRHFDDFHFIPCMPYAHKYADAVTELGVFEGIKKYLPGNFIVTGIKGAVSIVTNQYVEMMKLLVDSEMKLVEGLNVGAIFLQNIMTDMLLGLGMYEILGEYVLYVERKYKVIPGIITMNFVEATRVFSDVLGMRDVAVCSPVNKIGFRMNPSQRAVEEAIRVHKSPTVAMSVFASGAIPAEEGIKYVASLRGIDSVLFGASSRDHIERTYDLINRYIMQ